MALARRRPGAGIWEPTLSAEGERTRIFAGASTTWTLFSQRIGPGHEVSVLRAGRKRRYGRRRRTESVRSTLFGGSSSRGWALWTVWADFRRLFSCTARRRLSFRARKLGSSGLHSGFCDHHFGSGTETNKERKIRQILRRARYISGFHFSLCKRSALALLNVATPLGRRFARLSCAACGQCLGAARAVGCRPFRIMRIGVQHAASNYRGWVKCHDSTSTTTSELIAVCSCTYKRPSQLGRALDSLISIARPDRRCS